MILPALILYNVIHPAYNLFAPYIKFDYDTFKFRDGFVVNINATDNFVENNRGYLEFVTYVNYREGLKARMYPVELGVGSFFGKQFVYIYTFDKIGKSKIYAKYVNITDDIAIIAKKTGENEVTYAFIRNKDGKVIMIKKFRFGEEILKISLSGFNAEYLKKVEGVQAYGKVTTLFKDGVGHQASCKIINVEKLRFKYNYVIDYSCGDFLEFRLVGG